MREPDFILVGAMRGGTTALAAALDTHPDVTLSRPKEPSYFATLHGALAYSGPGDQWFASQNVADWDAYLKLFSEGSTVCGEASAMYLAVPETAESIRERLPSVKILIVLRDPLARAISAHSYLRVKGRETERRFTDALRLEEERRADGFGPMWWFKGASDYAPAVDRFIKVFGPSQVFVTTNEELKRDPKGVLDPVFDFLGVRRSGAPVEFLATFNINAGGAPKNDLLTRFLYPPDSLRRWIRQIAPESGRDLVRNMRKRSANPVSSDETVIGDETRAAFAQLSRETAELLGRDLTEWWPSLRSPNAQ